jgi:hypothetical protein
MRGHGTGGSPERDIMNGAGRERTRGVRPGRPSVAPSKTWLRIAELAGSGMCNFEIAEQLNRGRVKTLSGKGQWSANRVKHAKRAPQYAAAAEALEDQALMLVPAPRSNYLFLSQFWLPDAAARKMVLVPLGGRPLDPVSSSQIRRELREGKTAALMGPGELLEISTAAQLKWQHYASLDDALRKAGVVREGEFVRVDGIDLPNRLPPYALKLSEAMATGRPVLPVKLPS